jgi:hypothetical protein
VRVCFVGEALEGPRVALRGAAVVFAQDGFPAGVPGFLDFFFVGGGGDEGALHGNGGCVVAVEECRVDFYAGDAPAGGAKAEDYPVSGRGVVAACLPAIVPGSAVYEYAGFADRGRGCDEVLGCCEPFVAEGEDFGAEGGRDEVCLNCQSTNLKLWRV